MQNWEYLVAWVYRDEHEVPTGEKGLFGGDKTTKKGVWFIGIKGEEIPLEEGLTKVGQEGWEMVGTAQSAYVTMAAWSWQYPSHWLYFKRPIA